MISKKKTTAGFALFEVLLATILLCGLIYIFISFFQNQQRQVNSQNVGKHLAIVMNDLLVQTATGTCVNGQTNNVPLNQCIPVGQGFQDALVKDGLNNASVTITVGP